MNKYFKYSGIEAKQSDKHSVISVVSKADEILQIAEIDRIRRSDQGEIFGFQRPKIKNHINEIRDYLNKDGAVLPNPIVLAFTQDISITKQDKNKMIWIRNIIYPDDFKKTIAKIPSGKCYKIKR